ncbi:LysM peptidoglycan-binding domain-containing protein [Insulibacter thermoxylanivorax]
MRAIGRRFGIPWQQLAETNRLANPRLIFPGQTLEIR